MKPSDFNAIPLCYYHHNVWHHQGSISFAKKYNLNLDELLAFYQAASGTEMP